MKRYIPIVRYVMLVGQDAPYLCALLTLKVPRGCVFEPRGNPGCWLDGGRCPGFKMGKLRLGEARSRVGHSVPSLGYADQAPWRRSSWPDSREMAAGPRKWGRVGQASPSQAYFLICATGMGTRPSQGREESDR